MSDASTEPAEPPETNALTGLMPGTPRSDIRDNENAVTEATRRLAAHYVRRQCNHPDRTAARHVPEECDNLNHRRDADLVLHILGLDDTEPVQDDDTRDALTTLLSTTPPPAVDLATLQQEYMIRGK